MNFRLLILVIQVYKVGYNTKINEIEKKIPYHDKYITTPEFAKLTSENFGSIFQQFQHLAIKYYITDLVKKTDFAGKLKKITLTKTRHAEVDKKLNDLLVKAKVI